MSAHRLAFATFAAVFLAMVGCGDGSSDPNHAAAPGITPGQLPGGGSGSSSGGSGDTTAPVVVTIDPPANAVGVQLTEPLTAAFSEAIAPASAGVSGFVVEDSQGKPVSGVITTSGSTVRFAPAPGALVKSADYRATLTPAIQDLGGNPLAAAFIWGFTTTTDAWADTILAGAPTPRADHAAVWTGNEMIVWGGDPSTDAGAIYRPATDTWRPTSLANAPTGRDAHTAVWTGTQMIVWGGNDGTPMSTGGRYTP